MTEKHIGFIGGGNMARSLIGGLIADGVPADSIWVAEPDGQKAAQLNAEFGINTDSNNHVISRSCGALILAVKPQVLKAVCQDIANDLDHQPVVISIAAGIRSTDIDQWLGGQRRIVRAMPNTPALLGCGATGLYANSAVSDAQRETAERIMRAVGIVQWLNDETLIDAVTAVSGSGPAYFFLLMEAIQTSGEALGLSPETAKMLTLQTALGAAKMAMESTDAPAELRRKVTSPGGTTERAIHTFQNNQFEALVANALTAAKTRSEELANEFGDAS